MDGCDEGSEGEVKISSSLFITTYCYPDNAMIVKREPSEKGCEVFIKDGEHLF